MSLNQLKRTLQREFTRNPAKSLTLLALLPVAGYFIAPLIWKKLPVRKGETASQPAYLAEGASAVAAVAVDTPPASPPGPNWQEVAGWIAADMRMKPIANPGPRDPFHKVASTAGQTEESGVRADDDGPAIDRTRPEDFGLQLTATIVGTQRSLAAINGRLYAQDAPVRLDGVETGNQNTSIKPVPLKDAFVVKSVGKTHVVLERRGELFRLTINGGPE